MQRRTGARAHTCVKLFWMDSDTVKINFNVWCLRSGGFVSRLERTETNEFHFDCTTKRDERVVSHIVISTGRGHTSYLYATKRRKRWVRGRRMHENSPKERLRGERVLHILRHLCVSFTISHFVGRDIRFALVWKFRPSVCGAIWIRRRASNAAWFNQRFNKVKWRFHQQMISNATAVRLQFAGCINCELSLVSVDWLVRWSFRHSFIYLPSAKTTDGSRKSQMIKIKLNAQVANTHTHTRAHARRSISILIKS